MSKTQWHNPTSATAPGIKRSLSSATVASGDRMHASQAGEAWPHRIGATEDPSWSNTDSREDSSMGTTWSAGLVTKPNPIGGNKAAIALTLVQRFSTPASWQLLDRVVSGSEE